jgi:hypothetical protein
LLESNFLIDIDNAQVGEPKFVFQAKTIQRMELMILSSLGWKMRALTPCSFIDYFLAKIGCEKYPEKSLIARSVQLILNIIKGILFILLTLNMLSLCTTLFLRSNEFKELLYNSIALQVLTSWNSGLLKSLQRWPFL